MIYDQLGEILNAQRQAAQALEDAECDHPSTHYAEVEHTQLPEQQSLYTQRLEICDVCGVVLEDE